jgi:hypothetical protein
MKYIKQILVAVSVLFAISILYFDATNEPEINEADAKFNEWIFSVIEDAKADSSYSRIPLDSKADQRWFLELVHNAWEKKISKDSLVILGAKKYPNFIKSFEFVSEHLPK